MPLLTKIGLVSRSTPCVGLMASCSTMYDVFDVLVVKMYAQLLYVGLHSRPNGFTKGGSEADFDGYVASAASGGLPCNRYYGNAQSAVYPARKCSRSSPTTKSILKLRHDKSAGS